MIEYLLEVDRTLDGPDVQTGHDGMTYLSGYEKYRSVLRCHTGPDTGRELGSKWLLLDHWIHKDMHHSTQARCQKDLNGNAGSVQHASDDKPSITSVSWCDLSDAVINVSTYHWQLVGLHLSYSHIIFTKLVTTALQSETRQSSVSTVYSNKAELSWARLNVSLDKV